MTRNTFEAKGGVAPDNYDTRECEAKALAWDTMWEEHQPNDEDEDTQADYDLREKMETYLGSCLSSQPELKENNIEITVEGGMVVEVDGLPVDWTFEITDKDCEFEGLE